MLDVMDIEMSVGHRVVYDEGELVLRLSNEHNQAKDEEGFIIGVAVFGLP